MTKNGKKQQDYEDFYIYGDSSEPEFDPDDNVFECYEFAQKFLWDLAPILRQIYDVACFVSFFANLFHLLILTRKELRTNLVYIVMIGICICDIAQAFGKISQVAMTLNIFYTIQICDDGYEYYHLVVDSVSKSLQIMSRQCSSFLILYLAAFRAFSVLFPMNHFTYSLMKPKSGILVVLCTGVLCSAWSVVYFVQIRYERVQNCYMAKRPVYVPWRVILQQKWESKYRFIDGCIAFTISILYVIVAVVLLFALCQNRKRQKNLGKDKNSNASMMIIVMAVTVFISEFAYGLLYFFNFFIFEDHVEQKYFEQVDSLVLVLFIVNSVVHAFICFFMSSQYRDTVKGLFCKKKQEKNVICVVENTASVEKASNGSGSTKRSY